MKLTSVSLSCFLIASCLFVMRVGAQQPPLPTPAAPSPASPTSGVASGGAPVAAAGSQQTEKLRQELQSLMEKANGGDSKAALELADRVMSAGNLDAASALYQKAAQANEVEAQEKLAMLLLNSSNSALWPTGHSWLDKAVQANSVGAMEQQAIILLNGSHGRERSVDEAVKLLKRACQLPGAKQAHFLLGNLAAQGVGMPKDGAIALSHFQEGAKAGSIPCLIGLHKLYREGGLVKKDLVEAERFARQAADQGNAEGAFEMGIFCEQYRSGGPDWKEAAKWLKVASDRGFGAASTRLASYHINGKLGEANLPEAVKLCRMAADQGDAEACYLMAVFYQEGKALPQDLVAATGWLRLGAERGYVLSENEYGLRLVAGIGVSKDPAQGAQWLLRAAQRGMPAAMVNLGELLLNGVGVNRNPAEGVRMIETAAKANHIGAQQRLAVLLQSGAATGVADPVGAAYWAERGVRGDKKLADLAKQLRDALDANQKGELDRRLKAAKID